MKATINRSALCIPRFRTVILLVFAIGIELMASATDCHAQQVDDQVDGIEVTQAIQDMAQSVPLIAGKPTIVRVYVTVKGKKADDELTCTLTVEPIDPKTKPKKPKIPPETKRVAEVQAKSLLDKRNDLKKSFNFVLPLEYCSGKNVTIRASFTEYPNLKKQKKVNFISSPPLRVRMIGFRLTRGNIKLNGKNHEPIQNNFQNEKNHKPSQDSYDQIKSWLSAAYPVANVEFSMIATDPTDGIFVYDRVNDRSLRPLQLCAEVAAIRNQDMATSKIDKRTLYYGLLSSTQTYQLYEGMPGISSDIPQIPDPTAVATSLCFRGDDVGHELGHSLGRYHVFDDRAPKESSTKQGVGIYVGDGPAKLDVYSFDVYQDMMDYADKRWISKLTYKGIRDRLEELEQLGADGKGPATPDDKFQMTFKKEEFINVICLSDVISANVISANPVSGGFKRENNPATRFTPNGPNKKPDPNFWRFKLRATYASDDIKTYDVFDTGASRCQYPYFIDTMIPAESKKKRIVKIEVLDGFKDKDGNAIKPGDRTKTFKVLQTFEPGEKKPADVTGLTVAPGTSPNELVLNWDRQKKGIKYIVQASTDGGGKWFTISVNNPSNTLKLTSGATGTHPGDVPENAYDFSVVATNGLVASPRALVQVRHQTDGIWKGFLENGTAAGWGQVRSEGESSEGETALVMDGNGGQANGTINGDKVEGNLSGIKVTGVISNHGMRIDWDNSSYWTMQVCDIRGKWQDKDNIERKIEWPNADKAWTSKKGTARITVTSNGKPEQGSVTGKDVVVGTRKGIVSTNGLQIIWDEKDDKGVNLVWRFKGK